VIWCQGFSEPEAGSDLASLRTHARRDGDGWLINGQKIWTTTYWGEYMLLAARTRSDAKPKHAGISMFIVPMDTPGITVRTSETMYGGTFANVFYDNVRLPLDALVGEVDGGWQVLTGALSTERGFIGGGIVIDGRLYRGLTGAAGGGIGGGGVGDAEEELVDFVVHFGGLIGQSLFGRSQLPATDLEVLGLGYLTVLAKATDLLGHHLYLIPEVVSLGGQCPLASVQLHHRVDL